MLVSQLGFTGFQIGPARLARLIMIALTCSCGSVWASDYDPTVIFRIGFEKGSRGFRTQGLNIVTNHNKAHRGKRCLTGIVRKKRQGRNLWRELSLRSDRIYHLQLWARSSHGSRITIFLETKKESRILANFSHVPKTWHKYTIPFSVDANLKAKLRIMAPSSFWASPGQIWLDELTLLAFDNHGRRPLCHQAEFCDFSQIVKSDKSSVWAMWTEYKMNHDSLHLAQLRSNGSTARTWQLDLGANAKLLDASMSAHQASGGVYLLWSEERQNNWDIYYTHVKASGPGEIQRVTTHPAVDRNPSAIWYKDQLWIVWESNRDQGLHQIYLHTDTMKEPVRLSTSAGNHYQPQIAANSKGKLFVVWHAFQNDNYDLFYRSKSDGDWQRQKQLTQAQGIDRNVRVACFNEDLWLAWEHATYQAYHLGKASHKRVHVARLSADGLEQPRDINNTQLAKLAEQPMLGFDSHGRLWVSYRVPRDRITGWDLQLLYYAGASWSKPIHISAQKGLDRPASFATLTDRLLLAYQNDNLPGRWLRIQDTHNGSSRIDLVQISYPRKSNKKNKRLQLDPFRQSDLGFQAASIRRQMGEERLGWSIEHQGKQYKLLFGDLHEHSDISVCDKTFDETPDYTYQMMRDVARYDFGALTDHGKCFNHYLWHLQRKLVRANRDGQRFETLLAQEWTSTFERSTKRYPYGYYGHRILVFSDSHFAKWYNAATHITPTEFWAELARDRADYVVIPHQLADIGNVPFDWGYHNPKAEPVAEIFQSRGSYECDGCPRQAPLAKAKGHFLQDAWAKGVVIGVIAAPDHEGGLGKAAVYAASNSAADILEALRARRTFGTSAAKIFLDFRVNGLMMGQIGPRPEGKVTIQLRVDAPSNLRQVEIIRNNQVIVKHALNSTRLNKTFVDDTFPSAPLYYYLRVTLQNGELAWSSPVWLQE